MAGESTLKKRIKNYCKVNDISFFLLVAINAPGFPDIGFYKNGCHGLIETKNPNKRGRLSKAQEIIIGELVGNGARVLSSDDYDQCVAFIKQVISGEI